jgi:arylsulfatase A-like enzyme
MSKKTQDQHRPRYTRRDARYKLVAPRQAAPMLFDLQADPLERVDLLAGAASQSSRQKAQELQAAYERIRAASR